MGFAPSSLATTSATAPAEETGRALDWHALKSRFVAAHALRRELAESASAGGSFILAGSQALASLRESSVAVNLTALANGKGQAGIDADVIGTPTPMTEESYD
ncbi:hypothetical protein [Novosphingobium sp. TH158]|uniref:hypothetical protein n=1 Tax=Novosphingobium sp. TH158 TaxID=2067455 RepID=UPI001181923D|nr:hypothetical protein [Novosphingobium sp. TH158]